MQRLLSQVGKRIQWRVQRAISQTKMEFKIHGRFLLRPAPKHHNLPAPLIVSLTSYPARFGKLALTLKCLLSQSISPDRVILWIAFADQALLPQSVLQLQAKGLEIAFCEDMRSFKKIIPTLQLYPNCFITTADDDLYYWPTWLEELVEGYRQHPGAVISHTAHRILLDAAGLPRPYSEWQQNPTTLSASPLNFQTGAGGVLYPPGVFHKDVLKTELFKALCPLADDVWLYWMMRLSGVVAHRLPISKALYVWPESQKSALYHDNLRGGGNDRQIKAMIHAYGFPSQEKS